jgi:hypothetical protein
VDKERKYPARSLSGRCAQSAAKTNFIGYNGKIALGKDGSVYSMNTVGGQILKISSDGMMASVGQLPHTMGKS